MVTLLVFIPFFVVVTVVVVVVSFLIADGLALPVLAVVYQVRVVILAVAGYTSL